MPLLLILILAVVLIVLLTRPHDVDRAAKQASATSRSWADRAGEWLQIGQPKKQSAGFREWATGKGAEYFPDDFREWLEGLSPSEADKFSKNLADYSNGLEYNLVELVEGGLDNRPSLLNVFVEAIVIYSQEYRKALKAHKETDEGSDGEETSGADEKKPAQKKASRRKAGSAEATA
jgi:hypothetical protein